MPGKDGTGPLGRGPMTGHGGGECVLRESENNPGCLEGIAGKGGRPVILKRALRFWPAPSTTVPKGQTQ